MRITGLVLVLLGTIFHAAIALKTACTNSQYWMLYGAMLVVMFGSFLAGVNAGKRIED